MSKKHLIKKYKRNLNEIKSYSRSIGLSDDEFKNIFNECINQLDVNQTSKLNKWTCKVISNPIVVFFSLSLLFYSLNCVLDNKPFSFIFCKIQEFIYPGLRLLRILSIPVISTFPSLTELYDETCLIPNPYFQITDMDCWPCHSINHISETTSTDFQPHSSPPFIYKVNQKYLSFSDIQKIYNENKNIFDKDAPKIIINNAETVLAHDLFNKNTSYGNMSKKRHYMWRLNRMFPTQVIRSLFPRPDIIPRLGHSTERFLMMDEPAARHYALPDPECNYVFVIQSQGERLIELQPAKECKEDCKTVPVLLKESYLLWYNWWYWRPVSHPTKSRSSSISYIGSYC